MGITNSPIAWVTALPRWTHARRAAFSTTLLCCQKHHIPVLPDQVLSAFRPNPPTVFVDGTLGAGGHASRVLAAFPQIKRYIGIDQDTDALDLAKDRLHAEGHTDKVTFLHGNFAQAAHLVSAAGVSPGEVDAMMLDIGVSSMQLDNPDRGFSFMRDGDLDMRMDVTRGSSAARAIESWSEDELGRVLREFGEEPRWRRVAAAIVDKRSSGDGIRTTHQLADVVVGAIGWPKRNKYGPKATHPATRTFQGIRIAVNDELNCLANAIPDAIGLLRPGMGRLAIVSFHSLEDRIVKTMFKQLSLQTGGVQILTKKPMMASDQESKENVRARSAKLRVVQRLENDQVPRMGRRNKYPQN